MPSVLFVCQANRYRSPIAAACFRAVLDGLGAEAQAWDVSSAGTWTRDGLPAWPEAQEKAALLGLDLGGHRSRMITAKVIDAADIILVMEDGQKEALSIEFPHRQPAIHLLSKVAAGVAYDIPDPVQNPHAGNVAREICMLIRDGYTNILRLSG